MVSPSIFLALLDCKSVLYNRLCNSIKSSIAGAGGENKAILLKSY